MVSERYEGLLNYAFRSVCDFNRSVCAFKNLGFFGYVTCGEKPSDQSLRAAPAERRGNLEPYDTSRVGGNEKSDLTAQLALEVGALTKRLAARNAEIATSL